MHVADSGPGIPAEALPHIFERFFKADKARGRSEGSGLGLSIAFENARMHGGELSAGNRPEGGAVFTLRFPKNSADEPSAGSSGGAWNSAGMPEAARMPGSPGAPGHFGRLGAKA